MTNQLEGFAKFKIEKSSCWNQGYDQLGKEKGYKKYNFEFALNMILFDKVYNHTHGESLNNYWQKSCKKDEKEACTKGPFTITNWRDGPANSKQQCSKNNIFKKQSIFIWPWYSKSRGKKGWSKTCRKHKNIPVWVGINNFLEFSLSSWNIMSA